MAAGHQFEHLQLVLRAHGEARLGLPPRPSEATAANRDDRAGHSGGLSTSATAIAKKWQELQASRQQDGLPAVNGVPLLLKIDPSLDLDELRHYFDFEIVSEQEDGFVIAASEDISLESFQQKLAGFVESVEGTANVARLHELKDDQQERLRRILTETLYAEWPTLGNEDVYVVEVGVACVGTWQIRKRPKRGRLKDKTWALKEAEWSRERIEAYEKWDELRDNRMNEVEAIIQHYDAEILGNFHDDVVSLPDSFTLRLKISGKGLKDLTLSYPYVFEVTEPDDIETPQQKRRDYKERADKVQIQPPPADAPTVCIIDSGIQEEHLWLEPAIDKKSSRCFLRGEEPTNIADYVGNGGHGTRVAGAVLYGENVVNGGNMTLPSWLQNARILNNENKLPESMFPPEILRDVVRHYHEGDRKTRIFNHSITASSPCRLLHMSAWAAEVDAMCYEFDILIVQSTGNLQDSQPAPQLGITEFIANGQVYPDYLAQRACRVANPAQSLQALTVGSIAYGLYQQDGWRSFASQAGDSSAFSRCGLGIWDSIKPEVVEYGGDCLFSPGNPPTVGTPDVGSACYPELVRSTLDGGPAIARDSVGTSFAAPKVSRIAVSLLSLLPDQSCLLYRALIVQSASWPAWANGLTLEQQTGLLKRIGYGKPDIDRAIRNSQYRSTFISEVDQEIGAGECHIFQVRIPDALRRPGDEFDIRIEVTLSYVAEPRRTRRTHRGYLSVWLDWIAVRKGESIEGFRTRAFKAETEKLDEGTALNWVIQSRSDKGQLRGVQRNSSTVQKDWAVVKSNALPKDFCVAVRGHRGWSRDPESVATYAIAVSFEILGNEIPIYEPLRAAVSELRTEIEAELEAELAVEVEN